MGSALQFHVSVLGSNRHQIGFAERPPSRYPRAKPNSIPGAKYAAGPSAHKLQGGWPYVLVSVDSKNRPSRLERALKKKRAACFGGLAALFQGIKIGT